MEEQLEFEFVKDIETKQEEKPMLPTITRLAKTKTPDVQA